MKKQNAAKIKKKLILFSFALLTFLIIIQFKITPSWSTLVLNGQASSQIIKKGNTLIFGTNDSKLYFLNTNNSNDIQSIDLNSGLGQPVDTKGSRLLAISDDTLRLIDIQKKVVIWQVSSGNQYFFQTAQIYKSFVIAGSADGSLSAYRLRDGKAIWKFTPKTLDKLSESLVEGSVEYFGDFFINNNQVYFSSRDKTVYKLSLKKGSVIWKYDLNDQVVSKPSFFGKYIYLSTVSGKTISLNKRNGNVLWESTGESITCTTTLSRLRIKDNPLSQYLADISQYFSKWFSLGGISYFEFTSDGTLINRNGKTGAIVWKSESFGDNTNCPIIRKSKAIVTKSDGSLIILSLTGNNYSIKNESLGKIVSYRIISSKYSYIIPDWINPFAFKILVNNSDGDLLMISPRSGKIYWKFSPGLPIYNNYLVDKKDIYITTLDGMLVKLDKKSGQPDISPSEKKFFITQSSYQVGDANIFELSLKSKATFDNPWREADLYAVFSNEKGKTITIPGFYYDQDIWKIRFNPPSKGIWKWEAYWKPHGYTLTKTGQIDATTDTENYYLKISNENRQRLTLDEKSIFNGLGIGGTVADFNFNGTPLDDWAVGDSSRLIATDSAGHKNTYLSDKVISLNDYISTYGPMGAGFNMFRWSLSNGAQPIYLNLGYPTKYSVLQGKIGDEFTTSLRNNDIHIWLTLFGFDIPYKNSNNPADQYILKSYIRYMFARYGAFVDVWELANELSVPKNTATLLMNEIKSLDYEDRPISISSSNFNYSETEIISPHWYESESINLSDVATVKQINEFDAFNRPVVFSEQGNSGFNYDKTSAIRMRIRAWTAFFNQGILMFWNQSDSKDFSLGIFPANIYLGSEERGFTKILQDLTKGFPLNSKKVNYNLSGYGIRGYGLSSETINAAYFYHYSSPFTSTKFSFSISTKYGGSVEWIDPATGKILQKGYCNPGICNLSSPQFNTDISLFIKK